MGNLIKAELFKLLKLPGYKILVLGCICTGIFFSAVAFIGNTGYSGYYILCDCMGMLLVNSTAGCILAAIFIGNEFTNKTFGNSLLSGFSRRKLFIAKIFAFLAGLFQVLAIIPLIITVSVSYINGFGMDFSISMCKTILLLLYSLAGYTALGAVIILLAVLIRKEAVIIAVYIVLTYAYLFIRTNFNNLSFLRYTYLYQIELMAFSNNPVASYGDDTFSGGIYMAVMVLTFLTAIILSIFIFEKKELK